MGEFINDAPWWFFVVLVVILFGLVVLFLSVRQRPRQDTPNFHPPHVDDDNEPRARRRR